MPEPETPGHPGANKELVKLASNGSLTLADVGTALICSHNTGEVFSFLGKTKKPNPITLCQSITRDFLACKCAEGCQLDWHCIQAML